ncbi:MAG: antibiotic biosynthesis monooxygenase [bacterium]|nr:antibiotic biosynthesis monooxygenase [bacterium]
MNDIHQESEMVTLIISKQIRPGRIKEYEEWVKGINQAVKQFEGFLGVDVIRPRDPVHQEYVTIVRFNRYKNLKQWQDSSTCREWLEKSRHLVIAESYRRHASGVELWFTLPPNMPQKPQQPKYYKKVLLGILAVYPLLLLMNIFVRPYLKDLPYLLGLFISVLAVSALMAYPLLPLLTRLLDFWLYPKSNDSPGK